MISLERKDRLSFGEIASELSVSRATIVRWFRDGVDGRKLPTIKIGGRRYVFRHDLEKFVSNGQEVTLA
jgi:excisionase family DNA binding protein